jgi:hypothetical protein
VTDQPKTFPSIHGRCPACRGDSLFIGTGGWVTCSRLDCPNPSAADELLHGTHEVAILTARVLVAETELERLGAGEEPGWDPLIVPTPGQWIWKWNRATAEERHDAAKRILDNEDRAGRCFEQAHEGRVHDGRHAEMALIEVQNVVADMEATTGARTWAGWLRDAMKRGPEVCLLCATEQKPAPVSSGPAATEATEPAPDWLREQYATAISRWHRDPTQPLYVQGADAVLAVRDREMEQLRRERDQAIAHDRQPYPTAHAYERACAALHRHRDRAELLTATLREVLNAFTTARRDDGVIAGHFLEGAIHPDDMNRWRAALEPAKEQPRV